MTGPRLFAKYRDARTVSASEGFVYSPNMIESTGDKFIKVMNFCYSLSYWTSPVLLTLLYRKGYFTPEGAASLLKYGLSLFILYALSFFVRGVGRFVNTDYYTFISVLKNAELNLTVENRRLLSRYDFEFWAWPVDYGLEEFKGGKSRKTQASHSESNSSLSLHPMDLLGYCAIHTFGRRMVFPGATSIMNMLIGDALLQGRARLVEEKDGFRAKVMTLDGNYIDTMFLDRRGGENGNGSYLVVCCEGNAGFYEIGCTGTPADCGYSVLGWNHPGFGGSSGVPSPSAEQKAVEAVVQYAINRLGFMPSSIILFAWSIGGYAASWAAQQYPDVRFVILDATFDDLVPLAISKMPESWKALVARTIRKHMHLNIADLLRSYPGPILLIRRSKDEIITTENPSGFQPIVASNRGNFLLLHLLEHRYPKVVDESTTPVLQQWLAADKTGQEDLWREYQVDAGWCEATLRSYTLEHSAISYPMDIGERFQFLEKCRLAIFLASRYMEDFDSTHCTPLPMGLFKQPWSISPS